MKNIAYYQIDAFTNELFKGNPAGVCILEEELPEQLMQKIAQENNLSETAFVLNMGSHFNIRFFSPKAEVELCGHATLSAAHVLFRELSFPEKEIHFQTHFGEKLSVETEGQLLCMTFPADRIEKVTSTKVELIDGLHIRPLEVYKGSTDYLVLIENEAQLLSIQPDFNKLAKLNARGVIVTAPGKRCDFVSRFFAPRIGINEDYVTGSAHTSLVPFWSEKTGKRAFNAMQLSERPGQLLCELNNNSVLIKGNARTYLKGHLV